MQATTACVSGVVEQGRVLRLRGGGKVFGLGGGRDPGEEEEEGGLVIGVSRPLVVGRRMGGRLARRYDRWSSGPHFEGSRH